MCARNSASPAKRRSFPPIARRKDLEQYAGKAHERGLRVIIAGAGGAAHLPGVTAAFTTLPVIGVPIESKSLKGLDSLLSIVQMPPGVPVATVGIGAAKNAGLLAVQILAVGDARLQKALVEFKQKLAEESRAKNKTSKSDAARGLISEQLVIGEFTP